jgi:hypothetical protein
MSYQRTILATFCDDIRYEIGNKYSLIGCYKQDLVLSKIPATLPKLCASVTVLSPIDQPFERLTIYARLDNEVIAELELTSDQLALLKNEMESQISLGKEKVQINCHLVFSPLVLPQEGNIFIEANSEEGVIKGEVLNIRLKTESENALFEVNS